MNKPIVFNYQKYKDLEEENTRLREKIANLEVRCRIAEEDKPKRGEWRDTGSGQECSRCHEIQYGYDNYRNFCPNCGADMRGDSE